MITLNSTLGYENIARGNKTFFLPINEKYFKINRDFLFWSIKKLKKNIIWEDKIFSEDVLIKLDKVFKMKKKDYQKIIKNMSYNNGLMNYDKNNQIIKKLIKSII